MNALCISSFFVYPLKSGMGQSIEEVQIYSSGLAGDRTYAVIDDTDQILTAREHPELLTIEAAILDKYICFSKAGDSITVPRNVKSSSMRSGILFGESLRGSELSELVRKWMSNHLAVSCNVIEINKNFMRQMKAQTHDITYTDAAPILLTSEASLEVLNNSMRLPVGMNRFRPNLVVSGSQAFAEDDWKYLKIGTCEFEISHHCPRCVLTTIDPSHPEMGISKEPLKTLSSFRKSANEVNFGVYLIPKRLGTIRLNDEVIPE
tara:strand:- start:3101 stop:3889 length:789 start_codon:yes stop_codon:yes gene_type:complete